MYMIPSVPCVICFFILEMALVTLCEDVGQSRGLKAQTVVCVNHESHLNNHWALFPPFVAPEAIKELVFWNFSLSGGFHDFLTWRPFISFTPCSLLSIGLQVWLHECKVQECINFHSILLPVSPSMALMETICILTNMGLLTSGRQSMTTCSVEWQWWHVTGWPDHFSMPQLPPILGYLGCV